MNIQSLNRVLIFVTAILLNVTSCFAQLANLNNSINQIRKGTIIVNTQPGASVEVEQLSHEFWFGCAISNSAFGGFMAEDDKKNYKEKFLENFNSAVTENAVKWDNMERRKGNVNYSTVDAILNWTEENNIPLRGHNIFWGIEQFVQPWIKELNDEELRSELKNRAETLTARYKGRFVEYDLNNEMIHGNYYEDRLGPDITKLMAEWCQTGDPEIKLYLNDYDILTGNKLNEYMAQIRLLLNQGVDLAGIGVQGHLHSETFSRTVLKNALDSLAVFNLPIRITEFNMPGQRSKFYDDRNLKMTAEEAEQNARELADYYRICFAHPAVEGIIMWGFWEGANWIGVSSMYNRDWTPTPLAKAYKNLIFEEWWTKENIKADNSGVAKTPAFYGSYKITVDGISKVVDLTKENKTAEISF